MFSGIVQYIGTVKDIAPKGKGFLFSVHCPKFSRLLAVGSSVLVSGVCLTVSRKNKDTVIFEVMPETLRKTTLGEKKVGDRVNLEPSLRLGDEVGGHFVYGHVDGVSTVTNIKAEGDSLAVTVSAPQSLMKYIVPHGSVSIDGVSLTVAQLKKKSFAVSLIEYTQKYTTLGSLQVGYRVNVECDMMAKYMFQLMKK